LGFAGLGKEGESGFMLVLEKNSLSTRLLLPLFLVASPISILIGGETPSKYVVLMVTDMEGKNFHKAMADKEQDTFKKSMEDAFSKAKKTHADEKKTFGKENQGKKFEKPEPQKPKFKIVKRDIKTFLEAKNLAAELDKKLSDKPKTNGNGNGNGKSGTGNGNGKSTEKDK
jgi:hypothetical protein